MTGKRNVSSPDSSPDERQRKDLTLGELFIIEQSKRNQKLAEEKKPINPSSKALALASRNAEIKKKKKQEYLSRMAARDAKQHFSSSSSSSYSTAPTDRKGKNIVKPAGKKIFKTTHHKRFIPPLAKLPDDDKLRRKHMRGYVAYLNEQKTSGDLTEEEADYFT